MMTQKNEEDEQAGNVELGHTADGSRDAHHVRDREVYIIVTESMTH